MLVSHWERELLEERLFYIEERRKLQQAWLQVIHAIDIIHKIDWFATLTFREDRGLEYCEKARKVWLHEVNRRVYGVRYWRRGQGVVGVSAREKQMRGVWHYHLLLAGTGNLRRLEAMDIWDKKLGYGYARIYEYIRDGGADVYVSKYVLRGGDVEIIGNPQFALFLEQKQKN
jgi:hypothetical protein